MNAKHIESKFAAMGTRLKVREIPSRWRMGDRQWIDPTDFAVDIRRDGSGEFFELRVPTHFADRQSCSRKRKREKTAPSPPRGAQADKKAATRPLPLRPRRTRMVRC